VAEVAGFEVAGVKLDHHAIDGAELGGAAIAVDGGDLTALAVDHAEPAVVALADDAGRRKDRSPVSSSSGPSWPVARMSARARWLRSAASARRWAIITASQPGSRLARHQSETSWLRTPSTVGRATMRPWLVIRLGPAFDVAVAQRGERVAVPVVALAADLAQLAGSTPRRCTSSPRSSAWYSTPAVLAWR